LVNFKEPQGQLARWLEVLNQYNMTIQHRGGKQHTNADALSRLETDKPCKEMSIFVKPENLPLSKIEIFYLFLLLLLQPTV
jgi:hypothetical protein